MNCHSISQTIHPRWCSRSDAKSETIEDCAIEIYIIHWLKIVMDICCFQTTN